MKKRVIVGISGGVDSSVAAVLLKKQGYEVIGITFQFTKDFDSTDAKLVCKKLNIEHHILDYQIIFKEKIIDQFLKEYKDGITPNPCILCNKTLKIKILFDLLKEYNCDYIATGHYARITKEGLFLSADSKKDQTYFLSEVPIEILRKIILPLEGIEKETVRKIAEENQLVTANKKDSTDVCFITSKFKEYLKNAIKSNPGEVIDIDTNEVVGRHKGLPFYTIGQRRGLDIGGTQNRIFVVGKNIEKNILYICQGDNNDALISDSCVVENFNRLDFDNVTECTAKFRYRQDEIPVTIEYLNDNKLIVNYKQGAKRVTPGQACVLYKEKKCLGGGTIKEVRKQNNKIWYL